MQTRIKCTQASILGKAGCLVAEAAHLAVWLVGLFGIVGTVCVCVAKVVIHDSVAYDEAFVWRRKLPPEAKSKR
ncbi:hypothetical protein DL346_14200 [Paenibacillus montanisoli]|uniref:Uncharacterized protein n=1 Tax=Paenibacillus montanisoli TaxID=2081970 RepID=A0A328U128_9BACL|nr:hypothetical protein DL346_14200 [Paenibacillus montanisoli]